MVSDGWELTVGVKCHRDGSEYQTLYIAVMGMSLWCLYWYDSWLNTCPLWKDFNHVRTSWFSFLSINFFRFLWTGCHWASHVLLNVSMKWAVALVKHSIPFLQLFFVIFWWHDFVNVDNILMMKPLYRALGYEQLMIIFIDTWHLIKKKVCTTRVSFISI